MATSEMRMWAVKGAEQRLVEIAAEAQAIYRAFPELRRRGGAANSGGETAGNKRQGRARGGRRKMSAAARKRIGDAQRKRWAEVKAKQASGDGPQGGAKGSSRKKR
jgi:hypothetical protein